MANMAGQSWSLSKASEALVRNLRTNSMVTRSSDPEMNIGSTSKPRELFGENDRNIGEDSTHSSSIRQMKKEKEEEEDDVEEKVYQGRRLPMPGRRLTFLFVIECLVFFLGMGLLIASLVVHRLHCFEIWGVLIWKWCLIVIIILCGRLLTGWIIQILAYLIENNFILKNKFLYYVYGLKTSIQVCIWMPLFLLTWFLLFDRAFARSSPKTIRVLIYVWRTIAAGLVVVVIEEVKTLLLRKLASTFHANFYFERIQESIFHQYILQRLSGPSLMEIKKDGEMKTLRMLKFKKAEEGKKGSVEKGVIDVEKLQKIEQENVSAWTMNGLVNAITSGLSTTTKLPVKADMNVDTEENSISDYNYGKTTERSGQMDVTINSEFDARLVANSIFGNCAKPGSKSIDREDFLRFMTGEEAESVFPQFEGGLENGKITKTAFSNWVVKLYLERKSLAHVLNDTKMNMKYLNKIGAGFVLFAIPVIWLLLMGFPAAQVAIFLSSLLIPMIFVFGSTFKTLLESVIFVFVTHPFAVGDRCVVDGEQVVVVEMNILTTIFLTSCNEKVYYPNATLAVKPIKNLYRSPDMGDFVEFSIDASTSMETIGALKSMIVKYIESKPRFWHPKHTVEVKEIENINKLKMVLHIMHTMNHHNMGEKITRRSELLLELKIIFETLGIKYSLPPQEVNVVSYVSAAQQGLT